MTPPTNGAGQSVADRARGHLSAVDGQQGMFDRELDAQGLEALMDQREDKKAKKLSAAKAFKEKDDLVKARLAEFNLAVGEVARVGKYRVEVKATPGGHREFDVGAGERINIKLFDT